MSMACHSCRTAKRRCIREAKQDNCTRCARLKMDCVVDGLDHRRRYSKERHEENHVTSTLPSFTYRLSEKNQNFILLEMSGNTRDAFAGRQFAKQVAMIKLDDGVKELDELIDGPMAEQISVWAGKELGSIFPLLPPLFFLRQERLAAGNTCYAALVLETSQYLLAAKYMEVDPPSYVDRIEAVTCAILKQCLANLLSTASVTLPACLALQILCFLHLEGYGKHEPVLPLLAASLRAANAGILNCKGPEEKLQGMLLRCSAFAWELTFLFGTIEGHRIYKPDTYKQVAPSFAEIEEIRSYVKEHRPTIGFVIQEQQVKEDRSPAHLANLDRAAMIASMIEGWDAISQSTNVLRQGKRRQNDQIACLGRTGESMAACKASLNNLAQRRLEIKEYVGRSAFELMVVEDAIARTLILGQCLRNQIDAAFDIDSHIQFAGLGNTVSLHVFVAVALAEAGHAGKVPKTPLEAAKAVLEELVGQLPQQYSNGSAQLTWEGSDTQMRLHELPPIMTLGYLFEAAMLVLETYAPHIGLSRSTLTPHDSWALLAWAVQGLIISLLTTDVDEHESEIEGVTRKTYKELCASVVERNCSHLEARMVLDLPFPLKNASLSSLSYNF